MNSIRQIQELNKRELENGVSPDASWHADYRDTAYIYIGGLPFELSEGDIITIFSQFGEPVYINLIRDKETGKSKGFAFLKYEDQRSTDLAVDNLGGSVVMGRTLRVDHTRYKKKEDVEDEGIDLTLEGEGQRKTDESESEEERVVIKEERELAKLIREHDDDDPMKAFLIEDKKEEIKLALARSKGEKSGKSEESRSKHRHHHRSRREKDDRKDDRKDGDERRSRHRKDGHKCSRRSHSRDESPPRHKERDERTSGDRRVKTEDSMTRRRSPSYERSSGDRRGKRESSIPRKRSPSPRDREYDRRRNHTERRRRSRSRS